MRSRRSGITLIETLVVVSIVGLLIALILPAVQSARESARRLECANHLKQLGAALAQHHEQRNHFPSAVPGRWRMDRHLFTSDLSGLYDLLPFLGELPLFNSFNVTIDTGALVVTAYAQNETAKLARVGTFLCPSDSKLPRDEPGPNSYRFNVGTGNYPFEQGGSDYLGKGAAFVVGKHLSAADFSDGLSRTVGVSERLSGSGSPVSFDRSRDFWYADVVDLVVPERADQLLAICRSLTAPPQAYTTKFGRSWCWPFYGGTCYNHVDSPNTSTPDCSAERQSSGPSNEITHYASVGARSAHPGGIYSLRLDGSASFVRDGINRSVWRALGTRSGSEAVSDDTL